MSAPRTAVVVESDPETAAQLGSLLYGCGFSVRQAPSGTDGVAAVDRWRPTLVTLDLEPAGLDGFEAIRRIRTLSEPYVLAVAKSASEEDQVLALTAGADDFIAKPLRPAVLQARVQALQRRPRRAAAAGPWPRPVLEHRGVMMDPWLGTVHVNGLEVSLTGRERQLLRLLLESGRRTRTRTQLALFLTGRLANGAPASGISEATIDAYVCSLRRKLRQGTAPEYWLQTVRGAGYRLMPEG